MSTIGLDIEKMDPDALRKSIRKSMLLEKTPLAEQNKVKLLLKGRQIHMMIPNQVCSKFAPGFQELLGNPWGFQIDFNTFFFSQGINIQHALRLTLLTSDPLQNDINLKAFAKLNAFYQVLDKAAKAKLVVQVC